jgi:hypothetical protein
MRNALFAAVVTCAAVVLGCPFKKSSDADAAADGASAVPEAEAPAAAVVVDAAPIPVPITAKNSADVARFPAETPVSDDDLKLASPGIARTSPKTGTVVATLKPGTDVLKIAEYQTSILVTFADPNDASATLMGWIGKESFSAPAVSTKRDAGASDAAAPIVDAGAPDAAKKSDAGGSDAKKPACAAGQVAVVLSKDPVCRKKCTKDADCKGGAAGTCANATTAAGGLARVCANE